MLTQLKASQQCRQNQFCGSSNMGHSRWKKEAKKIQWRLQRTEQMGCGGENRVSRVRLELATQRSVKVHDILSELSEALVGLWLRVVTAPLLSCCSENLSFFMGNLPHFPEAQDFHMPPFACHPWTCLHLLPFP